MKDLIGKINLDKDLANAVLSLDMDKINILADKCKSSFSVLKNHNDITRLAVCLCYAVKYTKGEYDKLGVSYDIFYDTMQDINIWCINNDNKGLKNYNWIKNHLKLELFKIGRLQYQFCVCNNTTLDYSRLPFDKGDNLLYVHIPQGEKLIFSDCVSSLQQSKDFFEKYFPEFQYRFLFSESWLLYSENFLFMSPSSNILQFQSLFDIVYSVPIQKQAIERIFGKRQFFKSKYPTNTSLQRQAKNFMLSGNKLGIGIGIIDKLDI